MKLIKLLLIVCALITCPLTDAATEKTIKHDQIELWTESFGSSKNPAILLICGAGSHCINWTDDFCNSLVNKGFFVIRFDHRDIGKSTIINYEKNPYTLDDMAKDAIAILDAYSISQAHIVGHSMGGFIGQLLAINYPDRILSLTSMMSSPDHRVTMAAVTGNDTTSYALPPPDSRALKVWQELKSQPSNTKEEKINNILKSLKLSSGKKGFDENEFRMREEKIFERTRDFSAIFNHWAAMSASPERTQKLKNVKVPTLVIHGDCDAVLPKEHGIATAQAIPNAKLEMIPDMGHLLCNYYQEKITNLIYEHIKNINK